MSYSTREVERLVGLTRAQLRAFVRDGSLAPERGSRGELRFTFQDLVLLRTARGLLDAEVPPLRIRTALRRLRERLPEGAQLAGLHIRADGGRIVVRDGGALWQPESGQALFDFDVGELARGAAALPRDGDAVDAGGGEAPASSDAGSRGAARAPRADRSSGGVIEPLEGRRARGSGRRRHPGPDDGRPASLGDAGGGDAGGGGAAAGGAAEGGAAATRAELAEAHYQRGYLLEDDDPAAARAEYHQALALDPAHVEAHVNLGRLLHDAGDPATAERHYRVGLALQPDDVTANFNLAVALEDLARPDEALAAYQRALAIDPGCADAHYNLHRLFARLGRSIEAMRHLQAYRKLTRR